MHIYVYNLLFQVLNHKYAYVWASCGSMQTQIDKLFDEIKWFDMSLPNKGV